MPPQAPAPTPIPAGPANPLMMALLRARAQQGAQGMPTPGPAPNGLPVAGAPAPVGMPPAGGQQVAQRPGAPTPTQQITKAASQAQSPLLDQETRNIAKSLVQKLLQHM